ncbi:MAG TPA: tRNA pseudouridine(55) synthase TruB [Nitrospirota bacterium]|nr:tRNA pseudouridine(55) synthase TruB [Nitrospirota bacterium]
MDGIVNINKPAGITSHDVVLHARRILGEKRIGHTGTLDPLATGVLVLCVGRATRVAQYIEAAEKEYRAVMRLGVITDTLDAKGRVLENRTYSPPRHGELDRVIRRFTGIQFQTPPAFSAVKIGGTPSYRLARQGMAKPNKPKQVTIHEIELLSYENPLVGLAVRCSKGVYIRSLCADMGDALGMGAHLVSLERTRSGRFSLAEALTLEELQTLAAAGDVDRAIMPIDRALAEFPAVSLTEAESVRIAHGNRLPGPETVLNLPGGLCRLHDPSGRLLALARLDQGVFSPEVVFPTLCE